MHSVGILCTSDPCLKRDSNPQCQSQTSDREATGTSKSSSRNYTNNFNVRKTFRQRWNKDLLTYLYVVVHVYGVRRCLWTAATNGPICHQSSDFRAWRVVAERFWQGKPKNSGEKPVPVPLCPAQIPHKLTESPRWSWRLTAWTMAQSVAELSLKLSMYATRCSSDNGQCPA
jgi:hypothetical protein